MHWKFCLRASERASETKRWEGWVGKGDGGTCASFRLRIYTLHFFELTFSNNIWFRLHWFRFRFDFAFAFALATCYCLFFLLLPLNFAQRKNMDCTHTHFFEMNIFQMASTFIEIRLQIFGWAARFVFSIFYTNLFCYFRSHFLHGATTAPIFVFDRLRNPKSTTSLPLLFDDSLAFNRMQLELVLREPSNAIEPLSQTFCRLLVRAAVNINASAM